jgi:hypothetical protein
MQVALVLVEQSRATLIRTINRLRFYYLLILSGVVLLLVQELSLEL